MPSGYGIDQTAEGLLPWSFVTERMAAAHNYWVVTSSPNGRPHAAPVWGLWLDGRFYFSTDSSSRKGRNLAANPALIVHLESGDEAVILEGVAEPLADPALRLRFANDYDTKYAVRPDPAEESTLIYGLRPTSVLAWQEKTFPNSATRWHFDQG
jgi:pyridoxine/pyridoxamine 5'-phosphate oxidase